VTLTQVLTALVAARLHISHPVDVWEADMEILTGIAKEICRRGNAEGATE